MKGVIPIWVGALIVLLVLGVIGAALFFKAPAQEQEKKLQVKGISVEDKDGDGKRDKIVIEEENVEIEPEKGSITVDGYTLTDSDGDGYVDSVGFSGSSGGSSGGSGGSTGTQTQQESTQEGQGQQEQESEQGSEGQGGEGLGIPDVDFECILCGKLGKWKWPWGLPGAEEEEEQGTQGPPNVIFFGDYFKDKKVKIPIGPWVLGEEEDGEESPDVPYIDFGGYKGVAIDKDLDGKFEILQGIGEIYIDEDEDSEPDLMVFIGDNYDGYFDFLEREIVVDIEQDGTPDIEANQSGNNWWVCIDLDHDGHCDVKALVDPRGNILDKQIDVFDLSNSVDANVLQHLNDPEYLEQYARSRYGDYLDALYKMKDIVQQEPPEMPQVGFEPYNPSYGIGTPAFSMGLLDKELIEGVQVENPGLERCKQTATELMQRVINEENIADMLSPGMHPIERGRILSRMNAMYQLVDVVDYTLNSERGFIVELSDGTTEYAWRKEFDMRVISADTGEEMEYSNLMWEVRCDENGKIAHIFT